MQNEQLRLATVALEQAHARYVDLYDFAPVGHLLLDENGLITQANLTGATLVGEERGSLVGRPLAAFVGREDADRWHLFFSNLVRVGEPQVCALPLHRRDGTALRAHLACQYTSSTHGESAVRVVLTDVSEQMRAEDELRRSERRMRALVENSGDLTLVLDREGRNLYVGSNVKRLLGRLASDSVGKLFFEHAHPEDLPALLAEFRTVAATPGATGNSAARFLHEDGSWRFLDAIARNELDNSAVEGIVVNVRDITDQRRLEEQVHQAQRLEKHREARRWYRP
jgi:PAS domain S-box-containing protein